METRKRRNAILALVGLAALSIYVLACTSFSPDDTKVLYPAFDGPSGRLCVAAYDRESARSETLFLPMDLLGGGGTNGPDTLKAPLLRPQWFADGRRVLVAWESGGDLALAVVPWAPRGAFRMFFNFPATEGKHEESFMAPMPLVGDHAFIQESGKSVLRLDLMSGALVRHEYAGEKCHLSLWPAPGGRAVFYIDDQEGQTFGRLDPQTFNRTPIMTFTNDLKEGSFFSYSPDGQRIAFLEKANSASRLVVLEKGKPVFSRPMGTEGKELAFGNALFSRKGDALLAGYWLKEEGRTNASFGLMEIPFSSAPIRQTPLVARVNSPDGLSALYFQIGVSHDGKTAAASSAYLACLDGKLGPGDCALFLIDLSDPKRRVTKVPIPLPTTRPALDK
jgi:hypothetical protein